MSPDRILSSDVGAVREIVIDRPEARNALSTAMLDDLALLLIEAERDPSVSCVLLRGAGEHFSAGWDLGEASDPPALPDDGREHGYAAFMTALESLRKPVVAAVRGVAVGIGFTMLGHVDLVVLGESARMRAPFAPLGLCPEAGSSSTFPEVLGRQRTAELFFTGRWLGAEEAVTAGLGVRVVPDEDVVEDARALAAQVAAQPLVSLVATKELLGASRLEAARRARRLEDLMFADLLTRPAHRAALAEIAGSGRAS